jgi:hypothetical protein
MIISETVPQLMVECGLAGVRAVVIITAGFAETGVAGARLERAAGGGVLDDSIRRQMLAEVRDRFAQAQQDAQFAGQRIARQAEAFRIPLDRIIDFPAAPSFDVPPRQVERPRRDQPAAPPIMPGSRLIVTPDGELMDAPR